MPPITKLVLWIPDIPPFVRLAGRLLEGLEVTLVFQTALHAFSFALPALIEKQDCP